MENVKLKQIYEDIIELKRDIKEIKLFIRESHKEILKKYAS